MQVSQENILSMSASLTLQYIHIPFELWIVSGRVPNWLLMSEKSFEAAACELGIDGFCCGLCSYTTYCRHWMKIRSILCVYASDKYEYSHLLWSKPTHFFGGAVDTVMQCNFSKWPHRAKTYGIPQSVYIERQIQLISKAYVWYGCLNVKTNFPLYCMYISWR